MDNERYQQLFYEKIKSEQYDYINENDSDGGMMPLPADSQSDIANKIQVANQSNVHFLSKNNVPISAESNR